MIKGEREKGYKGRKGMRGEEAVVKSYAPAVRLLTEFKSHEDVKFDTIGQTFSVISEHKTISVFNSKDAKLRKSIMNHKYQCSRLLYHPNQTQLILNSFNETDHKARLLDIEKENFVVYFREVEAQITSMATNPDFLAVCTKDNKISLFDLKTAEFIISVDVPPQTEIALHPNGKCLAVCSDTQVALYDIRKINEGAAASINIHGGSPVQPFFGKTGKSLIVYGSCFAKQFQLSDLKVINSFEIGDVDEPTFAPGFAFTQDESYSVFANLDKSLSVYENSSGELKTAMLGPEGPVNVIDFCRDTYNFVTCGTDCIYWTVDLSSYNSFFSKPTL